MTNREKAARTSTRGNIFFFGCIFLALFAGAFGATSTDTTVLIIAFSACGVFLALGGVLVFLHSRSASRYMALAREEEARLAEEKRLADERNLEKFTEDGLPGAFCYEIRKYSAPQLRLIIDEQESEYTPEEFAFIKKVLAEREAAEN